MENIIAPLMVVSFFSLAYGNFMLFVIGRYIKIHHPALWDHLLRPSIFSPQGLTILAGCLLKKEDLELNDNQLVRLGGRYRMAIALSFAFLLGCVLIWVSHALLFFIQH